MIFAFNCLMSVQNCPWVARNRASKNGEHANPQRIKNLQSAMRVEFLSNAKKQLCTSHASPLLTPMAKVPNMMPALASKADDGPVC